MIAPAEAEAQCCELERLGLVDGIITDDSDVFVFGGQKVYRNIFNQQQFVEEYVFSAPPRRPPPHPPNPPLRYRAEDARRELAIPSFLPLALLLGGDYTQGVKGVGIVNAMEILAAFDMSKDVEGGLKKFKEWMDKFDPTDQAKDKKLTSNMTEFERFHEKHKRARTRWSAPSSFRASLRARAKRVQEELAAAALQRSPSLVRAKRAE